MTITLVALRVEVPVTGWEGNRNEKVIEIKVMRFQSCQFCQRVPANPNFKYKQKAKKVTYLCFLNCLENQAFYLPCCLMRWIPFLFLFLGFLANFGNKQFHVSQV